VKRILALVVFLLCLGTPAYAATQGTAHHEAAVTCTETHANFVTPSNNQGGPEWRANSCGWQIRGRVRCLAQSGGAVSFKNGGWVRAVDLISWATCPGGTSMTDAYAQWRTGPGASITTQHFWP